MLDRGLGSAKLQLKPPDGRPDEDDLQSRGEGGHGAEESLLEGVHTKKEGLADPHNPLKTFVFSGAETAEGGTSVRKFWQA